MARFLAVVALLLALALVVVAPLVRAPQSPTSTPTVVALAVDYWKNYSDPASDVVKLYTSNMTPVVVAGAFVMSPFPDSVNILWLRSGLSTNNVTVTVQVKGSIANLPNTTYEVRLYTRSDNSTHFILDYSNLTTTIRTNATGAHVTNITGNSTISSTGPNPTSQNTLTIRVAAALLGNVTTWNLDATATQLGTPYSYRDFGWDLPGNPGSTPTAFAGIVTDAATGAALAGVNVSVGAGIYTTTNASGAYTLPVQPGTYNVTFSLGGYYTQTKQATVDLGTTATLSPQLQKLSVVDSLGIGLWILIGAVLVVLVLLAVIVMRRRKPAPPAKPQ